MQKLKLWCQELLKDFFSGKTEYIERVSDEVRYGRRSSA